MQRGFKNPPPIIKPTNPLILGLPPISSKDFSSPITAIFWKISSPPIYEGGVGGLGLCGRSIKIGILKVPSHKLYWSQELHCPKIVDVMPCNRYQELLRYLNFVNNGIINTQDKLAEIRPLILMVQDEFVKIEPEE